METEESLPISRNCNFSQLQLFLNCNIKDTYFASGLSNRHLCATDSSFVLNLKPKLLQIDFALLIED